MSECTHDCSTCGEACGEREKKILVEKPHEGSQIKKVIGVVSGKGGVGKSLVTSLLAVSSANRGKRTAILDADITGPSIPQIFGLHGRAEAIGTGIMPAVTEKGIEVMSINLLLDGETDPVVWRGPIIASAVKQFWTDVVWNDVDYMFVDMPPGTGDVPITVFQSLPIDGIVVVTTPQELVGMIVDKAINMAKMVNVPILGIVENMAYFKCPDCGAEHEIFGYADVEGFARERGIDTFAKIPIDPNLAALCDSGNIERCALSPLEAITDKIESL